MNKNVILATFFLLAGTLITTVVATAPDAEARGSERNIQINKDNEAYVEIEQEADDYSNDRPFSFLDQ